MDMEFPTESSDLLSMCLFPQSSEAAPMATTGGEAPLDPLDFLLDAPADQLKSGGEPMPPRGTLAAAGLSLDLPAVGAANGLDLDSYLMGDGSGLGLGLGLSPAGLGVADSGTSPLTMGLEPMLTSSATPRTLSASASPEPETKPRFQASKSPDPSRVAPQSTPSPDRERHSESSEDEASLSSSPRTSKAGTGKAPQASRKRKRSATKTSPASGPNAPISREELLDLVSKGLPKHLLKDNLTPAEQRELKRQRRLIKNRESAHNSRRRKKDYLNHLETKVASLEGDNAELRRKVHELQNHTHALEAEIAHLRAANPKAAAAYAASPQGLAAPVHSPFSSPGAFASARAAAAAAASAASGAPSGSGMSTNMKAASVCLMVMLFSFGLFFNGQQPLASLATYGGALSAAGPALGTEPVPSLTSERVYVGRVLHGAAAAASPADGVAEFSANAGSESRHASAAAASPSLAATLAAETASAKAPVLADLAALQAELDAQPPLRAALAELATAVCGAELAPRAGPPPTKVSASDDDAAPADLYLFASGIKAIVPTNLDLSAPSDTDSPTLTLFVPNAHRTDAAHDAPTSLLKLDCRLISSAIVASSPSS